jgi:hypothetical protein
MDAGSGAWMEALVKVIPPWFPVTLVLTLRSTFKNSDGLAVVVLKAANDAVSLSAPRVVIKLNAGLVDDELTAELTPSPPAVVPVPVTVSVTDVTVLVGAVEVTAKANVMSLYVCVWFALPARLSKAVFGVESITST